MLPLSRDTVWLDAGTADSLLSAAQTIQALQAGGQYVSCIEEIAYRLGYITREQLIELAQPMLKTAYGQYLIKTAEEDIK